MASLSPLLPLRHKQCDLFIADIFDNVPIKDEMTTMEHPFFSLSTKPDLRRLKYVNGENSIEVIPSSIGMPTIFDKDILLYFGSALMREIKEGRLPSQTLVTSPLDILTVTNRTTDGKAYKQLVDSLNRLKGCVLNTNYTVDGVETKSGFSFIDKFEIERSQRDKGRIISLSITVSDWYYDFLVAGNVLTIDSDYFQIRRSIDRRIYEIARKHCGKKKRWEISLDKLHKKTGSRSLLKKFRFHIRELVKTNHLPEYLAEFDSERDMVSFGHRSKVTAQDNQPDFFVTTETKGIVPQSPPPDLLDDVRHAVGVGADYYALWEEFRDFNNHKGAPLKSVRGSFVGFCRKKAAKAMRA